MNKLIIFICLIFFIGCGKSYMNIPVILNDEVHQLTLDQSFTSNGCLQIEAIKNQSIKIKIQESGESNWSVSRLFKNIAEIAGQMPIVGAQPPEGSDELGVLAVPECNFNKDNPIQIPKAEIKGIFEEMGSLP